MNSNTTYDILNYQLLVKFAKYLLSRHAKIIDPVASLKLIPKKMLMKDLQVFIKQALQTSSELMKNRKIVLSLNKADYLFLNATQSKGFFIYLLIF